MSEAGGPDTLRVLMAYPYMGGPVIRRLADRAKRGGFEFLMDCGAYTAWQAGKTILLDDYCRFIDGLPFKPWRYFALDVVGQHAATKRNYHAMVARGYREAMPVFTRGAPVTDLEEYTRDAEVVAMGGLAGAGQRPYGYVKAMMPHMHGKRLHVLGFTTPDWLKYVKPYSADSSSWLSAARYGSCHVYMGNGKLTLIRPSTLTGPPPPAVAERIRRYGFDPYALRGRAASRGNASMSQLVSALSWLEFSMDCRAQLGTRLFLAAAADGFLAQLIDLHDQLLELRRGRAAA